MFSKLSPFKHFEKFTLDLSEKKLLVRNVWKVYTRPTSASDFFHIEFHRTGAFEPINTALHSFNEIADLFDFDLSRSQFAARIKSDSRPS
jgi:hypothetical protein